MPQIPRLQNPQVQLNPLQGGEQHVQADPRAFGMGVAEQVGQIGGQVAQALDEADKTRAKDAVNKFMPVVNSLKTNFLSQKGENIWKQGPDGTMSLTDAGLKAFDSSHKDVEDTLGNSRQKQYFKDMASRLRIEYQAQLGQHESNEGKNWELGVHQSTLAGGLDDVATNVANKTVSEATMMKSLGIINDGLEGQAKILGWDRGTLDVERKKAFSGAHVIVLNGMIQDGDYSGAKDWAKKATADGELTPEAINHFGPLIKEGADFKETSDLVTRVMTEGGTTEEQSKKIDAAYPEDKHKRDMAKNEWKDQVHILEVSQRKAGDEAEGAVSDLLYGLTPGSKAVGWNGMTKSQAWLNPALTPDDRKKIRTDYENWTKRNQGGDSESKRIFELNTLDSIIRDPEFQAGTMTPLQLAKHAHALGGYYATALAGLRDNSAHAQGRVDKLSDVPLLPKDISDALAAHGLEPVDSNGKKLKGAALDKYNANRGQLYTNVTALMAKEQLDKKGPLTDVRKTQILDEQAAAVKLKSGDVVPVGLNPDVAEVADVTPAERTEVYRRWLQYQGALARRNLPVPRTMTASDFVQALAVVRKEAEGVK